MEKFLQDIVIRSYEVDSRKLLRPAAFMQLAQEIAMNAAVPIGFGYDAMMEHKAAWVLSRLHFVIHKMPVWRQKVSLQTWHRGLEELLFRRDYQILDEKGVSLLDATSSWVALNVEHRRIMRPSALANLIPDAPQSTDSALPQSAQKIAVPENLELKHIKNHIVNYSDIDFIGHANNVQYLVWAMDAIDSSYVSAHTVEEVSINFNKEVHLGESVEIFIGKENDTYYIEGRGEDGLQSFIIKIKFNNI